MYKEPINKMLYFGAAILTIGAISTFFQPKLRRINIALLSIGGACAFASVLIKSFEVVTELYSEEIAPVRQINQEIVEVEITCVTVRDKTRATHVERRIVRLTRTVRR